MEIKFLNLLFIGRETPRKHIAFIRFSSFVQYLRNKQHGKQIKNKTWEKMYHSRLGCNGYY